MQRKVPPEKVMARPLRIILLAAALLRFGLLAVAWYGGGRGMITPDSRDYFALSNSLAEDGEFRRAGRLETFRTPGYPVFLLIGRPFGSASPLTAAAAGAACDVLGVYLTFLLGRMLCGQRVGLWAAGLQAVAPLAVAYSCRILTDVPFTLLMTLSLLLLVRHFRTSSWWSLVLAAAAGGIACYFRPVGMLLGAVGVAVLLFRPLRFRRAAAFAGVFVLTLAPWVLRNGLAGGYWGFADVGSGVVYDYHAPAVLAKVQGTDISAARRELNVRLGQRMDLRRATPGELSAAKAAVAREVLGAHRGVYARLWARGDAAVWLGGATAPAEVAGLARGQSGTLEVLQREGLAAAVRHYFRGRMWVFWLTLPLALLEAACFLLAAVGALRHVRVGAGAGVWLAVAVVVVFALAVGPSGHPRFRVPLMPLLSVSGAAGAVALAEWRRRRKAANA